MKLIHYLILGLVLSGGGVLMWQAPTVFRQPTAADAQHTKNEQILRERLHDHIDRARAEGRKEVVRRVVDTPSSVTSIEQVIRDYSLVRVEVKDKETIVSDPHGSIQTWYKLDVLEVLQQQKEVGNNPLPEDKPSRFFPLLASESLLITGEGEVTIDDVLIKTINQDSIVLIPGREYLIAANLDCEGNLITPIAMVDGIFRIEGTTLKPLGHKNREIVREIEGMYGSNFSSFRSDIQSRQVREK